MAVVIRLSAPGMPARSAPAAITLAVSPVKATGNWWHRVTADYGTQPNPPSPSLSSELYPIPPNAIGPGRSGAAPELYPTWANVAPNLPRNAPWAPMMIRMGGVTTVAKYYERSQTYVGMPPRREGTPAGVTLGRITTAPRPRIRWIRQGGR